MLRRARHEWYVSSKLLNLFYAHSLAAEARTFDAARMLEIEPQKRLTLAVSLLKVQSNRVLDDLAEMFIKRMPIIAQRFFGLAAAPAG